MRQLWIPAALLALALGAPARADFTVQLVGPSVIMPGDSTHIYSIVVNPGDDDAMNYYGFMADLAPIAGTSSSLLFTFDTTATQADPNYVFYGDVSAAPYYSGTNQSLEVGDFAGPPVSLSGPRTLANLILDASNAAAGDSFTLTLSLIEFGNYVSGDLSMYSGPATITATLTVVPEPSSLALCGLGGLALTALALRRRSTRAAA